MIKGRLRKLASVVALLLTLTMALAACGGGGGNQPSNQPSQGGGAQQPADAVYTIGYNTWGSGVPILDNFANEIEVTLNVLGMRGTRASDDFSADRELQNMQNFIAAAVDGVNFQAAADPVLPQAAELLAKAEIPFVLNVFIAYDDDRAVIRAENPYYAGCTNSDLFFDGYVLGQSALRDGAKTAVLIGGNIGDNNMDFRSWGFRQSFVTEGGGTVLEEARCTSPAESLQKASDMLSAHRDADCLYAFVGDFIPGVMSAMDNLGLEGMNVYASCIDPVTAGYIKEGRIVEGNDGIGLASVISTTQLINFLDGHPILDPKDGLPAEFRTFAFIVNPENVDDYLSIFFHSDFSPITPDIVKSLMWRYNPDVSYQTYADLMANGLTLEMLLASHGR